jgi:predicted GNAT superfamily acetyltransferase
MRYPLGWLVCEINIDIDNNFSLTVAENLNLNPVGNKKLCDFEKNHLAEISMALKLFQSLKWT